MSDTLRKQRDERKAQLQKLAAERRLRSAPPVGRVIKTQTPEEVAAELLPPSSIGVVTQIKAPDGVVLAQRGEGEVRADRAGNTVDFPGRMNFLNGATNLKDALTTYNNADVAKRPNVPLYYEGTNEPVVVRGEQRFTTAPAPTKSTETNAQFLKDKKAFEAPFKQKEMPAPGADRSGINTRVTGAYGTAVGGAREFTPTPLSYEQRMGLAPLPPEVQKSRDALVGGPTLPPGMEMKDGKLRAYEKDPIKDQLVKNDQDPLDRALKAKQAANTKG